MGDAEAFRREYREQRIGLWYSGWAHVAFVASTCSAVIGFSVSRVRDLRLSELAVFPLGFLVSNLVEYLGHRGPMHHRRRGLGLIYQRHAGEHHRFFTDAQMSVESSRDFKMVLFPPVMLLFFLGAVAGPITAAFYWGWSANAGWIFAATGVGYYFTYECLHFAYHQSERSWIWRLPVLSALKGHHTRHHDPAVMTKANFNITFPICDALFGTVAPALPPGRFSGVDSRSR
jgi:hypothetical protein